MKEISTTIYDVASAAGVSISTVSRFLNNPDQVNGETGRKIQEAVDSLAYIPHGNTGSKSKRLVWRIGVLTPFFPAPSFVQRLQGMTSVFKVAHCELLIYTIDSPEQLSEYLHSIPFSKRLDGLIIMSMRIGENDAKRLSKAGLEVVMVEQQHPMFSSVDTDNLRGGALAAVHFLEKGYFSCGYVGDRLHQSYSLHPGELRWQGFQSTLAQAGHPVDQRHVRLGDCTVPEGYRMGLELLTLPDRPRAVFAMGDLQAIGILRAARELGLSVPGEAAVLGFDDIEAAGYVELSTVSQALEESGRLAAELLVSRLREPGRPHQVIHLNLTLVQRATT